MLNLDIVTPEKLVISESEISFVGVDTIDGRIGILPKHIALYAPLEQGELVYKKNGQEFFVAIHGGFIEIAQDKVTILADDASHADEINEALVEEARQKAQEVMNNKVSGEEFALAEAQMRRALLELKIVRKRSSSR
ncbi:MAG: ATP synthase F1 subunit epsilon [bacterium]|nr:ATP synthase F1 subunit epsilon [bacterium]